MRKPYILELHSRGQLEAEEQPSREGREKELCSCLTETLRVEEAERILHEQNRLTVMKTLLCFYGD